MPVTFEVWQDVGEARIKLKPLEGPKQEVTLWVDPRRNYNNIALYKVLEELLQEETAD